MDKVKEEQTNHNNNLGQSSNTGSWKNWFLSWSSRTGTTTTTSKETMVSSSSSLVSTSTKVDEMNKTTNINEETSTSSSTKQSKCPVSSNTSFLKFASSSKSPSVPSSGGSIEEQQRYVQMPIHKDQTIPLSTNRVISTIPRGNINNNNSSDGSNDNDQTKESSGTTKGCKISSTSASVAVGTTPSGPHHQPSIDGTSGGNWIYPSEQQFYNAMKRKGYTNTRSEDMSFIIQIHNAVNERTWYNVLKWEQTLYPFNNEVKLVKFEGDSTKISPRAWFYTNIFGYKPPFDRHDWYIDRGDGKLRRYVIDFYDGAAQTSSSSSSSSRTSTTSSPVNMYLDVRPAIDDLSSMKDRIEMSIRQTLPGIFYVSDGRQSNTSSTTTTAATPTNTASGSNINK